MKKLCVALSALLFISGQSSILASAKDINHIELQDVFNRFYYRVDDVTLAEFSDDTSCDISVDSSTGVITFKYKFCDTDTKSSWGNEDIVIDEFNELDFGKFIPPVGYDLEVTNLYDGISYTEVDINGIKGLQFSYTGSNLPQPKVDGNYRAVIMEELFTVTATPNDNYVDNNNSFFNTFGTKFSVNNIDGSWQFDDSYDKTNNGMIESYNDSIISLSAPYVNNVDFIGKDIIKRGNTYDAKISFKYNGETYLNALTTDLITYSSGTSILTVYKNDNYKGCLDNISGNIDLGLVEYNYSDYDITLIGCTASEPSNEVIENTLYNTDHFSVPDTYVTVTTDGVPSKDNPITIILTPRNYSENTMPKRTRWGIFGNTLDLSLEVKSSSYSGAKYLDILPLYCSDDEHYYTGVSHDNIKPTIMGDANNDGRVDIIDVISVNRIVLGKDKAEEQEAINVDINKDGKPDSTDSLAIMKYIVGLSDSLE